MKHGLDRNLIWALIATLISFASYGEDSKLYRGVDILMVVDNSGSMNQEQQILNMQAYSLVEALLSVPKGSSYPAIGDIRLGVVSSDMGLQWAGAPGPFLASEGSVPGCGPVGDNGELLWFEGKRVIILLSNEISCELNSGTCPDGSMCRSDGSGGNLGTCSSLNAPDATFPVECPLSRSSYAESADFSTATNLATKAACLVQMGTDGCGIEQQLAAAVGGARSNPDFLRPDRLLVVLIVSDEDDCSIESPELFDSADWAKGEQDRPNLNVACGTNLDTLTSAQKIKEQLIAAKGGDEEAVFFAAIAGVPSNEVCSGDGANPSLCLADPAMEYKIGDFVDPATTQPYRHLVPACTREVEGSVVTEARPGRRYVELAQLFGDRGWLYSICDDDWKGAINGLAERIKRSVGVPPNEEPTPDEKEEAGTGLVGSNGCSISMPTAQSSKSSLSLLSISKLFLPVLFLADSKE